MRMTYGTPLINSLSIQSCGEMPCSKRFGRNCKDSASRSFD